MRTRPLSDIWWYATAEPTSDECLPEEDHREEFTVRDKRRRGNLRRGRESIGFTSC